MQRQLQCPRHPHSRVWRDGTYGTNGRRRQRYKCLGDGHPHRFTEPLPRQRTEAGECDFCERQFGPDEGAPAPRRHGFTASEIAWALTRIGEGWTYRSAMRGVRAHAHRGRLRRESSTLEDWIEVYAPIVLEPRLPHTWPSVLLLDDAPFTAKSKLFNGPFGVMFRVFAGLSYRSGGSEFVQLRAYSNALPASWADFLRQLDGRPDLIVCDAHSGMLDAIREVWGDRPYDSPVVWLCYWHLHSALYKLVRRAKLQNTLLGAALQHAFRNERTWRRFLRYAYAARVPYIIQWLERPDPTWWAGKGTRSDRILWQLRQQTYGLPHTAQALEAKLAWVRDIINDRKFVLRNRPRTNLLLGLMLLHSTGRADERAYAHDLRHHLRSNDGVAPERHLITDPAGQPSMWR